MIRLAPDVLDDARKQTDSTSDEKLASYLGLTGVTVRNLRHGRSTPSLETLAKLRALTGRPIDSLIVTVPDAQMTA